MTVQADIQAGLAVQFGRVADAMERAERYRVRCQGAIQALPIVSPLQTGSGTIDNADALAAKTGWYWDIKRLTCYGFTAGTVTVYRGGAGGLGEPVAPFLTNGAVFTYGKAQLLLHPGDRLIAVGSGITGTFQLVGEAIAFETWYLPEYIN